MNTRTLLSTFIFTLLLSLQTFAQTSVDDCDGLDFTACFSEKEEDLKLFEPRQKKTIKKIYETDEKAEAKQSAATPAVKTVSTAPPAQVEQAIEAFEIRERYTLGKSAQTPYSAFFVIEALHKKMAKTCPNGWTKLGEWSVAIESPDYYLHYEFACR